MAPAVQQNDPMDEVKKQMKGVVQNLFNLIVQGMEHQGDASQRAMKQEIHKLIRNLVELSRAAPQVQVHIPPEVVAYIEAGRNPDIYAREFVELNQRRNQMMKGRHDAFSEFRDIFAKDIIEGIPELKEDVVGVVKSTNAYIHRPMPMGVPSPLPTPHDYTSSDGAMPLPTWTPYSPESMASSPSGQINIEEQSHQRRGHHGDLRKPLKAGLWSKQDAATLSGKKSRAKSKKQNSAKPVKKPSGIAKSRPGQPIMALEKETEMLDTQRTPKVIKPLPSRKTRSTSTLVQEGKPVVPRTAHAETRPTAKRPRTGLKLKLNTRGPVAD